MQAVHKEFCRGASRIRHFLKIIGCGVASREADSKLKLVAALSKIEKQSKEESVHEAQRQLDKKSAAAAPQKQQEIEKSEEEECWSDEDSE
jgi:hypothetical protein